MRRALLSKFLLTLLCLLAGACGNGGGNVFRDPNERKDPIEQAVRDLEIGNADGAIYILEGLLPGAEAGSDKEAKIKSILSSGYMLKHQVDIVSLAVALADAKSGLLSNPLIALFHYLPEPTDDHISGIEHSITLLLSIDRSKRNTTDDVKLAVALLADLGLRLKALDLNGDGQISPAEARRLPKQAADAMAKRLADVAYAILAHYTSRLPSEGEALNVATMRVAALQSEVAKEPGESDGERIANYVQDHTAEVSSAAGTPGNIPPTISAIVPPAGQIVPTPPATPATSNMPATPTPLPQTPTTPTTPAASPRPL